MYHHLLLKLHYPLPDLHMYFPRNYLHPLLLPEKYLMMIML
jgi:hypothetical protein